MNLGRDACGGYAARDARPGAGVMFTAPSGSVLLMKRNGRGDFRDHWAFPGGTAEGDETPEQTACREAREETGYPIPCPERVRYVGATAGLPTEFHTFAAPVEAEFQAAVTDEHSEAGWFPLDRLPAPLHPGVEKTLSERVGVSRDMDPADFAALRMGLLKWLEEEENEPAHAEDSSIVKVRLLKTAPCACHALDPKTGECIEPVAMDRASARSFDKNGHLIVKRTPLTVARINEYYGREIPDSAQLGLDQNRRYRLLRDPEEIKKAASTWAGKPLMISHKPVSADAHPKDLVMGSVTEPEFEHPYLYGTLSVWDRDAINAIESGRQKELSSAYHYRADMTPGVYEGQPYDGVMRDLHGNHVALVRDGRAGSDVVVQDEKPRHVWAFDAFEESLHPRGKGGKFAKQVEEAKGLAELHEKRARQHDKGKNVKHEDAALAHGAAAEKYRMAAHFYEQGSERQGNTHMALGRRHSTYANRKSFEAKLAQDHNFGAFAMDSGTTTMKPISFSAFALDAGWEESKHPRDHGKFAEAAAHHEKLAAESGASGSRTSQERHQMVAGHMRVAAEHAKAGRHEHAAKEEKRAANIMSHLPVHEVHKDFAQHSADPAATLSHHEKIEASTGKYGAGESKSHAEHAQHHFDKAGEHQKEMLKNYSPATSPKQRDAVIAHTHAGEAHLAAHHDSNNSEGAHVSSKRAHEASEKASRQPKAERDPAAEGALASKTDNIRILKERDAEGAAHPLKEGGFGSGAKEIEKGEYDKIKSQHRKAESERTGPAPPFANQYSQTETDNFRHHQTYSHGAHNLPSIWESVHKKTGKTFYLKK